MGFERYFNKTIFDHPEIKQPVDSLKKALEPLIDQPESCSTYDTVTQSLSDINIGQMDDPSMQDSELEDAFSSLYFAARRQAVGLHKPECDNFLKHPLREVD